MIGRWLCSIGLHRLEVKSEVQGDLGRTRAAVSTVTCRRGCPRYAEPVVVDVEFLSGAVRPLDQGLRSAHDRAMAGSVPRQDRGEPRSNRMEGADQSDVSECSS